MKTTKSNRSSSFLALALAAAGFAAAASGCGLSVEAEIPEVTITQRDLMFQGVPDFGIGDVSVEKTYSQDHGKIEMPEGLESEIKTLGVTLRATSGGAGRARQLRVRPERAEEHGDQPDRAEPPQRVRRVERRQGDVHAPARGLAADDELDRRRHRPLLGPRQVRVLI
jgi:hypothetical protein